MRLVITPIAILIVLALITLEALRSSEESFDLNGIQTDGDFIGNEKDSGLRGKYKSKAGYSLMPGERQEKVFKKYQSQELTSGVVLVKPAANITNKFPLYLSTGKKKNHQNPLSSKETSKSKRRVGQKKDRTIEKTEKASAIFAKGDNKLFDKKPKKSAKQNNRTNGVRFDQENKNSEESHCICGVASSFNPAGFSSRKHNYDIFYKSLKSQGVPLLLVELAFSERMCSGDRDRQSWQVRKDKFEFSPRDADWLIQLETCSDNVLWQKERLLNIAVENLPSTCRNVAWIDTEVIFEDEKWATHACSALEEFSVVRLFRHAIRLEEVQSPEFTIQSGRSYYKSFEQYMTSPEMSAFGNTATYGTTPFKELPKEAGIATGYAWAMHRSIALQAGFYDKAIVGGGDSLMRLAATKGDIDFEAFLQNYKKLEDMPAYRENFILWAEKFYNLTQGKIGTLTRRMYHLYHGSLENRRYFERNNILIDAAYDPGEDVGMVKAKVNRATYNGKYFEIKATPKVLEWTSYTPAKTIMHQRVKDWFANRNE